MCFGSGMIVQSCNDSSGFRDSISIILKHSRYKPHVNYIACMLYRLFTLSEKSRMIFGNDCLPHRNRARISLNALDRLLKFFENTISGDAAKLWVKRSNIGLLTHDQLFTRTGKHSSSRHGYLRYDGSNIRTKHLTQIVNDRLCRGYITARSM